MTIVPKDTLLKQIKVFTIITIGLFINAFAWVAFLIPGKIIGGGITGVATLVYYATQNIGFPIPVGVTFFIINIFLIFLAIKILGANFGVKTIFSVVVLTFFFSLLQGIMPAEGIMERDPFLFAVIGGALAGAGVGIVFTQGGSTGGTDIIAMIINKYRNISPGRLILYMDLFIISSSILVFHNISNVIYGFVTMAVVAYTIDLLLEGQKQSVQIFIFSKYHDEISSTLGQTLHRGVTILYGQGWYTKADTHILLIVTRKHELPRVLQIIKSIDPDAFVSVGSVMGTYGKGFEKIRS
ncbi:MAG TPA: YitT family protein [Salinivirgaceae bacterium]|nr:YitT family protein [Salinivirgaceae bacterium]